MIFITYVDLDDLVFSRWFLLFKAHFPLVAHLLSPWIAVKGFELVFVFLFNMTSGSHIDGEISEDSADANVGFPSRRTRGLGLDW